MPDTDTTKNKIQKDVAELSASIFRLADNLERLRRPLLESRYGVPEAANQLGEISRQTEAAAHRMLDKVEKITQREEQTISDLGAVTDLLLQEKTDEIVRRVRGAVQRADANLNDAYAILEALQFQDVTSQQMSQAANELGEIETKLRDILAALDSGGGEAPGSLQRVEATSAQEAGSAQHGSSMEQKDIDNLFAQPERNR
ncbi:MAG TPA: hypothetical protein VMY05_03630 [Acidobacteriota bacterium]|nr:hypothetical protein [Acidobacteriota bacterium]